MKTSLTLDETVTRVRSEPWNDLGCERKCGKKQIQKEKEVCQFKQKLRLSSCSTVSWNSQPCGPTDLFVDQHLDHINSTIAQRNMVDACTGLATYSAAHLCCACCLCVSFLFSCGRPLVGEGAHPHILRLISVWVGRSHHR